MSGTALHELAAFRHEALLYAGTEGFLGGTVPFIREGLDAGEPILVVVGKQKIGQLQDALGPDAAAVSFADMAEVGRNPARIIPAWRDFLAAHGAGRAARGIGEPVYAERSADELLECQRHEALLNVAFAGGAAWRLLCPYDTELLALEVVEAARHSHRYLSGGTRPEESADYRGDTWAGPGEDRLPDPPAGALPLTFGPGPLKPVRQFVTDCVGETLDAAELSDLMVAVTEAAGNSIVHGGGTGTVRVWSTRRRRRLRGARRWVDPSASGGSNEARLPRGERPRPVDGQPALRPRATALLSRRHRRPPAHAAARRAPPRIASGECRDAALERAAERAPVEIGHVLVLLTAIRSPSPCTTTWGRVATCRPPAHGGRGTVGRRPALVLSR